MTKTVLVLLTMFAASQGHAFENVYRSHPPVKVSSRTVPTIFIAKLINPNHGSCTAELVARDIVVTAAHCVLDHKTGEIYTGQFRVLFGLLDGKYLVDAGVTEIRVGTKNPEGLFGAYQDWALLRLTEPVGDGIGWFGVSSSSLSGLVGKPILTLTGFSVALEGGLSPTTSTSCSITKYSRLLHRAQHNCSMTRGASGGAIFMTTLGADGKRNYEIVAINTSDHRGDDENSKLGVEYSDSLIFENTSNVAIPAESTFLETLGKMR